MACALPCPRRKGAGIWVTILVLLGYWIGENEVLLKRYSKEASFLLMLFALTGVSGLNAWLSTRSTLERGRRVREVLKQLQYRPLTSAEQIAVLLAVVEGVFDAFIPEEIAAAERAICHAVVEQLPAICARIEAGESLNDRDREALVHLCREVVILPNNSSDHAATSCKLSSV